MKMIYFMILFGLIFSMQGWAQQLTPSVIASDGGTAKAADISLSWTLGEYAVETIPAGGKLYTQGFHQPLLMAKVLYAANEKVVTGYSVSLAPNPVQSLLNITIDAPTQENVQVSLVDLVGRSMLTKQASGKGSMQLDMSFYISGVYLLTVKTLSGQLIRSFKVIKTQ